MWIVGPASEPALISAALAPFGAARREATRRRIANRRRAALRPERARSQTARAAARKRGGARPMTRSPIGPLSEAAVRVVQHFSLPLDVPVCWSPGNVRLNCQALLQLCAQRSGTAARAIVCACCDCAA
eukprot:2494887-Pleurochrysis_carterae.AAC.2